MRKLFPLVAGTMVACVDYGVTRSSQLDVWTQPDRDADVDILWVLDNSGSMSEEHDSLAEHAAAFTDTLAGADLEFRLALVSTDVADVGTLLGPILDEGSERLTETFVEAVQSAGIRGARDEEGFAAAIAGADPDTTEFGRGKADLQVVIYSDEDDRGSMEVDEFLDELEGTHSGYHVAVNVVVGDAPSGCASAVAAADAGLRYQEARELSGGVRESICTVEMDAVLQRLANYVIGLNAKFPLTELPLLNTLEVQVDDVVIPRRDVDGWRYHGIDNSIVFDGWAIPRPGAKIQAAYFDWTGGALPDTGITQ
ncbi:MAG: VWA domain-containing protein [Myxococcales bacterium]|nr:VWA domain-containing protein [Myxococcales bacterium]